MFSTDICALMLLTAVCALLFLNRRKARKRSLEEHDDDVKWL